MKEGVFSEWKGQRPLKFCPALLSERWALTTSTISARSRIRLTISSGISPRSTLPPDPTEPLSQPFKLTEESTTCQRISGSTRRPRHLAPPQPMHMEVEDRLAALPAGVRHHPVASFGNPFFLCHTGRRLQKTPQEGPIARVVQAADMPLGNHQHMDRRLRVDVLEREHLVVLQDDLGRNLPGADLAKETIHRDAHRPRDCFSSSPLLPNRRASSW